MLKNMPKSASFVAAIALTVGLSSCSSNKQNNQNQTVKPSKLTILSDRVCLPPPYQKPIKTDNMGQPALPLPPSQPVAETNFVPAAPEAPAFIPQTPAPESQPIFVPQKPVTPAPAAPAAQEKPAPSRTYKVVHGDNLSIIAYMYKVSLQDLMAENKMSAATVIYVGQTIKLPSNAAETPRPRPMNRVKAKNAPAKPATPKEGKAASAAGAAPAADAKDVYVVVNGDNFGKIARKVKIKEKELKALNPQIKDFSKLSIGQKINLKANGSAKVAAAPKTGSQKKAAAPAVPVVPQPLPGNVTTAEATPVQPPLPVTPADTNTTTPSLLPEDQQAIVIPEVPTLPPTPAANN